MSAKEKIRGFAMWLPIFAIALMFLGTWAAADGPVADFPGFIGFNIAKTGDVAVDKIGNVYVNVTENDQHVRIWKFTPEGEGPSVVADIGTGTAYGLAVNAEGDVYAISGGTNKGVYRVGRDGIPVRLTCTEQIFFPNGLAFDRRGNLYVTDSFGGIWRIPPGEVAEAWLQDDLLAPIAGSTWAGANGIAIYHSDLYVLNQDKGWIVRIPIRPDGSPGQPDVWAVIQEVPQSPPALRSYPLRGDGLAFDVHGNVYVTVVTRAAVVRINAEDLSQETIAVAGLPTDAPLFAPLAGPGMLAFGTGKGGRQSLFVTNIAPLNPSLRGLVKIDAGVPGLPLP